jgi:(E)-4-hydroxy-3-methylbut-2-enyl-diphosphate synthase
MTNTPTTDEQASVAQCLRMIRAGAQLVRLTTQGKREIKSLERIRAALASRGSDVPVIADIHFNPALAIEAAKVADKIRINPGNYLKGGSIEKLLPPLLETCRSHGTAIRIGVNHGSLDPAIVEQFGDSPSGMVESAMQFLRVCKSHDFHRVVVSMKSSNPRVMIHSVRLLVKQMTREGIYFPLHLGVTEAGDGLEGRIKSAVGIAPLLLEGMGDTVRVSLTEPPENEMPVAAELVGRFPKPHRLPYDPYGSLAWDPFSFNRRQSHPVLQIGAGSKVKVISPEPPETGVDPTPHEIAGSGIRYEAWLQSPLLLAQGNKFMLLEQGEKSIQDMKLQLNRFCTQNHTAPVVVRINLPLKDPHEFMMELAGKLGSLLIDGVPDAVWIENKWLKPGYINDVVLMILQAAGARISRAEFIACPSCGRTHFDIEARLREIREATSHLSSLKIAVMGCNVNGPGEMADAHYGYVGAGRGRITLYKGRAPVQKNIPEHEALAALIALLKEEGDWQDP